MIGVAFGIGAALCWGCADYFASVSARRTSAFGTVFGMHVTSLVLMTLIASTTGLFVHVGIADIWPFILLGVVGTLTFLSLYRALEIGPISVVCPIVSANAVVTLLLAVAILGDRLNGIQTMMILVTLVGVVLTSTDVRQLRNLQRRSLSAVALALAAMLGFGGFTFGVSYYSHRLGWFMPVFAARIAAGLCLFSIAAAARVNPLKSFAVGALLLVTAVGVLDTAGYFSFNFGIRHTETSIVAASSATLALVPVVLGVVLLEERPVLNQWVGVVLTLAGVMALGATI